MVYTDTHPPEVSLNHRQRRIPPVCLGHIAAKLWHFVNNLQAFSSGDYDLPFRPSFSLHSPFLSFYGSLAFPPFSFPISLLTSHLLLFLIPSHTFHPFSSLHSLSISFPGSFSADSQYLDVFVICAARLREPRCCVTLAFCRQSVNCW